MITPNRLSVFGSRSSYGKWVRVGLVLLGVMTLFSPIVWLPPVKSLTLSDVVMASMLIPVGVALLAFAARKELRARVKVG